MLTMKKLLFLMCMFCFSNLNAQMEVKREATAGDYLIKSSRNSFIGNSMLIGGGAMMVVGVVNGTPLSLVGACLSITGFVFIIDSKVKIRKAGIILNQNGIGIKANI
jgi:hypothetical protein